MYIAPRVFWVLCSASLCVCVCVCLSLLENWRGEDLEDECEGTLEREESRWWLQLSGEEGTEINLYKSTVSSRERKEGEGEKPHSKKDDKKRKQTRGLRRSSSFLRIVGKDWSICDGLSLYTRAAV